MSAQDERLAALRVAMMDMPGNVVVHDPHAPSAEMSAHGIAARERMRAMANWDPSYPGEKVDFYQEYVQRHAPITMSWLESVDDGARDGKQRREATGIGILSEEGGNSLPKAIAPMDDGSVCIWDICSESGGGSKQLGSLLSRSIPGLLSHLPSKLDRDAAREYSKSIMTETGAVECVSIDAVQRRGYFAVHNTLNEIDLNDLRVVSRSRFPFPITALSEAKPSVPLTVGTNMTIHLHDPRQPSVSTNPGSLPYSTSDRCELIAGSPPPSLHPFGGPSPRSLPISAILGGQNPSNNVYATLSQPGPLSILHLDSSRPWDGNGSIWVAGRFTSLLNYDRRFFPRLRGHLHSGARLSSLTLLPHPYIPREMDLMKNSQLSIADVHAAKSIEGNTLIAAGEYKGKGSLELYGLSPDPAHTTLSSDSFATPRNSSGTGFGGVGGARRTAYQNRHTASSSKLLAVSTHGARLVFSDGNGGIKWVERDGWNVVRSWNVNDAKPAPNFPDSGTDSGYSSATELSSAHGMREERGDENSDIVQKIMPVPNSSSRIDKANLLCWTGDGRLGMLGFGPKPLFGEDGWRGDDGLCEEERKEQERASEYAERMRRALERQADEVRWVRGMGLPGL
jgi:hypothetical protein